jgi:hypothetical protein
MTWIAAAALLLGFSGCAYDNHTGNQNCTQPQH